MAILAEKQKLHKEKPERGLQQPPLLRGLNGGSPLLIVLLRSDVISDINWSSPQIVYDIFIRSEIRSYLQLLQDEINWI